MPGYDQDSISQQINEEARRIFEGLTSFDTPTLNRFIQSYGDILTSNTAGGALYPFVPGAMNSLRRGEVIAAYRNEQGLRYIRDTSRWLCMNNEYAIGAMENTISFTVGTGLKHIYTPINHGTSSDVKDVESVVERFIDDNDWIDYEQELCKRGFRDGEWFLRFFPQGGGLTQVRVVEPEHVTSTTPDDTSRLFGINLPDNDAGGWPISFSVVNDPRNWSTKDVDSKYILHAKFNVDRNSRRGLPTLFAVAENLERAERTLRNFAVMAQVMATHAVIRTMKGSTRDALNRFQDSVKTATVIDPYTGEENAVQKFLPGSVITTNDNTQYTFPAAQVNITGYVDTLQADLRAFGVRLVMPEYMVSGDAGNANYGSNMIAEAPTNRKWARDQLRYRHLFVESRTGNPSVIHRVINFAVEDRVLRPDILSRVRVTAKAPNLIARDPYKETQRLYLLVSEGIMSKAEWAEREGLDYQSELDKGAEGDFAGLGLNAVLSTMECKATGKTGPCKTKPDDEPKGQRTSADLSYLDTPGENGKTMRDEWVQRYGLDAVRPEQNVFTDLRRIEDEKTISQLLNVPSSGLLFDKSSGSTLLFGRAPNNSKRLVVVALHSSVARNSKRLIRIRPKKDKYLSIEIPDSDGVAGIKAGLDTLLGDDA